METMMNNGNRGRPLGAARRGAARRGAASRAALGRSGATIALAALALFLGFGLAAGPGLYAQDVDIVVDEEALFGSEDDEAGAEDLETAGIEKIEAGSAGASVSTFLKTEQVRIGGSVSPSLGADWTWTDPWTAKADPAKPDSYRLTPNLPALIYLDARPEEDFRAYASVKTNWPFVKSYDLKDPLDPTIQVPNFQLFELFSDFNWQDKVFLRIGKHTVKWGVGYFWSPADVLNVTSIDITDPTAQREGPISLRAHYPLPQSQNNLWAYALVPNASDPSKLRPEDMAGAAKAEVLVGGWELGFGGFYQRDKAPRGMVTATGSVRQFSLFGEAVASWGSDKTFTSDIQLIPSQTPGSLPTINFVTRKESTGLFFSGTAGFSYAKSDWNFNSTGQYFYNGDGYEDTTRKDLIKKARNLEASLNTLNPGASAIATRTLQGLVVNSGRHYGALSLSRSELGLKDLTGSALVIANLSDLSGFVQPTLSYRFFDRATASLGGTFYWSTDALWGAGKDGEYVVIAGGPSVTISVKASLGGGRF